MYIYIYSIYHTYKYVHVYIHLTQWPPAIRVLLLVQGERPVKIPTVFATQIYETQQIWPIIQSKRRSMGSRQISMFWGVNYIYWLTDLNQQRHFGGAFS